MVASRLDFAAIKEMVATGETNIRRGDYGRDISMTVPGEGNGDLTIRVNLPDRNEYNFRYEEARSAAVKKLTEQASERAGSEKGVAPTLTRAIDSRAPNVAARVVVASFVESVADRSLSAADDVVTAGQLTQLGIPGLEEVDPETEVLFTPEMALWLTQYNDTFFTMVSAVQNSASAFLEQRREELEKNSERSQPGTPKAEQDVTSAETTDSRASGETTPPSGNSETPTPPAPSSMNTERSG